LDLVSVETTSEKASPPEKGEKKKKTSQTDSPPEKGQKNFKKRHGRTLVLVSVETTPEKANPPEKGEKKNKTKTSRTDTGPRFCRNYAGKEKKKNQRRFRHRKSLWPVPPQKTLPELSHHGQTDGPTQLIV
jgi:hypothetical protein